VLKVFQEKKPDLCDNSTGPTGEGVCVGDIALCPDFFLVCDLKMVSFGPLWVAFYVVYVR